MYIVFTLSPDKIVNLLNIGLDFHFFSIKHFNTFLQNDFLYPVLFFVFIQVFWDIFVLESTPCILQIMHISNHVARVLEFLYDVIGKFFSKYTKNLFKVYTLHSESKDCNKVRIFYGKIPFACVHVVGLSSIVYSWLITFSIRLSFVFVIVHEL